MFCSPPCRQELCKNQTACKILIGYILNLQTCFESPGIERASLSTCRNGSPEKDIQNWHQLKRKRMVQLKSPTKEAVTLRAMPDPRNHLPRHGLVEIACPPVGWSLRFLPLLPIITSSRFSPNCNMEHTCNRTPSSIFDTSLHPHMI